MAEVSSSNRIVKFAKGEYLFHQNDHTRELYIIQKGIVRIFKNEGTLQIDLDTVGAGMVVGEIATIDGGPRSASGIAIDDTEALLVPVEEFQGIIAKVPEYFKKIALILVQRLREADEKINLSIEGNKMCHVAALISFIAFSEQCTATDEGYEIDSKFLENELISLMNLQISEITEILEKIVKQGLIRIVRNKVILKERDALDQLAVPVFERKSTAPAT
jgi:CRP/FNR family transcriptional regulator, cyclic AMP receptor protein